MVHVILMAAGIAAGIYAGYLLIGLLPYRTAKDVAREDGGER